MAFPDNKEDRALARALRPFGYGAALTGIWLKLRGRLDPEAILANQASAGFSAGSSEGVSSAAALLVWVSRLLAPIALALSIAGALVLFGGFVYTADRLTWSFEMKRPQLILPMFNDDPWGGPSENLQKFLEKPRQNASPGTVEWVATGQRREAYMADKEMRLALLRCERLGYCQTVVVPPGTWLQRAPLLASSFDRPLTAPLSGALAGQSATLGGPQDILHLCGFLFVFTLCVFGGLGIASMFGPEFLLFLFFALPPVRFMSAWLTPQKTRQKLAPFFTRMAAGGYAHFERAELSKIMKAKAPGKSQAQAPSRRSNRL